MEIISNNLIEPWLYASSTGLSKTAIILAAIFWAWLWGGIGLLLATPLTVCLAVMGKYIPQLGFLDVLLGTRSAMAPSDQFYQRLLSFREDEATTVAREFLKEHSLVELCDLLLVPALIQIKAGLNEGVLDDRHLEFACETIDEFMTEQTAELQTTEGTRSESGPVVFVPAGGITDETIVRVMSGILEAEGFLCETLSSQSFTTEIVTDMSDRACAQICISVSPPLAQRKARYLLKRLTGTLPNVPTVTAIWGASQDRVDRLRAVTSSVVVTSMGGAMAEIKQNLVSPGPERASGSTPSTLEPDKMATGG